MASVEHCRMHQGWGCRDGDLQAKRASEGAGRILKIGWRILLLELRQLARDHIQVFHRQDEKEGLAVPR
jgi:hypothetical protein